MKTRIKWKAIIGLIAVWIAVFNNWGWIWGIIFLLLVIPELKLRRAHFIEEVDRGKNPFTYWLIIGSWCAMSLYVIVVAISPKLNPESMQFIGYQSEVTLEQTEEPKKEEEKLEVHHVLHRNGDIKKEIIQRNTKTESLQDDSVKISHHHADPLLIVGFSVKSTFLNNQYKGDLDALWKLFGEHDLTSVITAKKSQDIYVVYSAYDRSKPGDVTITIGYNTFNAEKLPEGIVALTFPSAEFTVLSKKSEDFETVSKLWEIAMKKSLKSGRGFDVERYCIDKSDFKLKRSELWVSSPIKNKHKQS
ncbi:hypothetical protein EYV94_01400 [Puteibacter caeruleilacunae]|nr:hypothetical protein EYV94_01400 [Puteibacter caeruleilacunae]